MRRCLECRRRFAGEGWECPECGYHPDCTNGIPVFAPELAKESEGWTADFSDHLAREEEKHFWFGNRNRLFLWVLQKYFPSIESYFELGCGTGFSAAFVSQTFPNLKIGASDITLKSLEFAKGRAPEIQFLQLDGRMIPFEEEFDVVGAYDVLEHIEDDALVLSEIHRTLKPGGGIILTVPQHPWLWSVVDEYSYHKRRYTRFDLVNKVEVAGFRPILVTSFMTFLLPLVYLSRWRLPKKPEDFDPASEYRLGKAANLLLGEITSLERAAIRFGARFPWGASLLLVGRKD